MGGMKDLFGDQPFGTDPHTLHRRDSPLTSRAAAYSVDTTKLEKLVYDAIRAYGAAGCIAADLLAQFPHKPYSSITARFRALEDKGLITCGPDTRERAGHRAQRVMRATR